jgi:hypothetical protein
VTDVSGHLQTSLVLKTKKKKLLALCILLSIRCRTWKTHCTYMENWLKKEKGKKYE